MVIVDGLDELIGNLVELARRMRDLVRVENVEREARRRLLTELQLLVNTRRLLRKRHSPQSAAAEHTILAIG